MRPPHIAIDRAGRASFGYGLGDPLLSGFCSFVAHRPKR